MDGEAYGYEIVPLSGAKEGDNFSGVLGAARGEDLRVEGKLLGAPGGTLVVHVLLPLITHPGWTDVVITRRKPSALEVYRELAVGAVFLKGDETGHRVKLNDNYYATVDKSNKPFLFRACNLDGYTITPV